MEEYVLNKEKARAALCKEISGCDGVNFDICDMCDHYKIVQIYNGEFEFRDDGHIWIRLRAIVRERRVALTTIKSMS